MSLIKGFNANEIEPAKAFEPLPAGDYQAAIVASEEKTTSAGTGQYLSLTFQIIEGTASGRKLFANLNLDNPNAEAVKIARAELSAICRAVGVLTPGDASELHDRPLTIKVGVEKRKDTGEMQNRIKGYFRKGESSSPNKTLPGVAPSGGNVAGGAKPWERKST